MRNKYERYRTVPSATIWLVSRIVCFGEQKLKLKIVKISRERRRLSYFLSMLFGGLFAWFTFLFLAVFPPARQTMDQTGQDANK